MASSPKVAPSAGRHYLSDFLVGRSEEVFYLRETLTE